MTKVTVYPKFTGQALDVEQDEADSLAAQGLLLDGPIPDSEREPRLVTVTPRFTGRPMQVSEQEAASLAEQGLLLPEPVPAGKHEDAAPTPDADSSIEETP